MVLFVVIILDFEFNPNLWQRYYRIVEEEGELKKQEDFVRDMGRILVDVVVPEFVNGIVHGVSAPLQIEKQ